jgi:hypothetical protein
MMIPTTPRIRVISDNDFAGDPDGLFQLAHLMLSRTVETPLVIGSHFVSMRESGPGIDFAERSADAARELLSIMGLTTPVIAGSSGPLSTVDGPSPAARSIVAEARRSDTDLPLYVVLGGSLTELAAALRLAPDIADRLTAVWIGGPEYDDPGFVEQSPEYNINLDATAAAEVFASAVPLWQVPRDAYRQCLVSVHELEERVRPFGPLGSHLAGAVDALAARGIGVTGTYCLGDSPLVLLTALQSGFDPDPASSDYGWRPAPAVLEDGSYGPPVEGARPIRVFTRLDVRLLLEDFFAVLRRAQ